MAGDDPSYDVLVDLSGVELDADGVSVHVAELLAIGGYRADRCQVTLSTGDGALDGDDGAGALAGALEAAARRRRHLFVIVGTVIPTNSVVMALTAALRHDPRFVSALPRFADASTDAVVALPGGADDLPDVETPRRALRVVAPSVVATDLVGACTLVRADLLDALAPEVGRATAAAALAARLASARRRGYRSVVVNTAVVPIDGGRATEPRRTLRCLAYPLGGTAPESARRFESLAGAAWPERGPRSLLVDCRALVAADVESSHAALDRLDAMAALAPEGWRVELVSDPAAAVAHHLAHRYPDWRHRHDTRSGPHAAALVLGRPADVSVLADLHRRALAIVVDVIDGTAWDTDDATGRDAGSVDRLVGRHADGLLHRLDLLRDGFHRRVEVAPDVIEAVAPAVMPTGGSHGDAEAERRDRSVLVLAPPADDGVVDSFVRTLADAFPFRSFTVVGGSPLGRSRVEHLGEQATVETVQRLMASAEAIVHTSGRERIGLWLAHSLDAGCDVFVRDPLAATMVAGSPVRGRLIGFDDAVELATRLARSSPRPTVVTGGDGDDGEDREILVRREHGTAVFALIERSIERVDPQRWIRRHDVLGAVGS